jgi:hypothetical protein
MNLRPIEPTAAAATQAAATATTSKPAAGREAPRGHAGPPPAAAPVSTPAATVSTTSVPATVKPEDRALYMQILKSVGGNVSLALAALSAADAKQA